MLHARRYGLFNESDSEDEAVTTGALRDDPRERRGSFGLQQASTTTLSDEAVGMQEGEGPCLHRKKPCLAPPFRDDA